MGKKQFRPTHASGLTEGPVSCQRRESSIESGSFRAMNRPSVPNFEIVWRLARVKVKGDCRLRELNRIESGIGWNGSTALNRGHAAIAITGCSFSLGGRPRHLGATQGGRGTLSSNSSRGVQRCSVSSATMEGSVLATFGARSRALPAEGCHDTRRSCRHTRPIHPGGSAPLKGLPWTHPFSTPFITHHG
jgi:hypothetical protein